MSRADELRAQLAAVEAEEAAEDALRSARDAYRANPDDDAAKAAAKAAARELRTVRETARVDRGLGVTVSPDTVVGSATVEEV